VQKLSRQYPLVFSGEGIGISITAFMQDGLSHERHVRTEYVSPSVCLSNAWIGKK